MSATRPLLLLAAPGAGGSSASVAQRTAAALRGSGHQVEEVAAGAVDDVRASLHAALAGRGPAPAALVVVGGDGTVQLAAEAAAGSGVPVFVVPAGSGNDAARALGVARTSPEAAASRLHHLLATGAPGRAVDVLEVVGEGHRPRTVVSVVAAGFDAAVNARANTWVAPTRGRRTPGQRLPPRARYTAAVLAELPAWRPRRYRLVLDDVAHEVDASLVAIANTSSYGGGMRIAPRARPDDGLVDVVVVAALGRAGLLALLPTAFAGLHVAHRSVSVHRAASVGLSVLDAGGDQPGAPGAPVPHGDGEPLCAGPLRVRVAPGALTLLT